MQSSQPTIAFVIVLLLAVVATFCPWAEIPMSFPSSAQVSQMFPDNVFAGSHGGGMLGTLTVDGFNGHVTLLGIQAPNWLLALLTLIGAVLALVRIHGEAEVPRIVFLGLFGVSALWLLTAFAAVVGDGSGTLGIGIPMLLLANVVGLIACVKLTGEPERAPLR